MLNIMSGLALKPACQPCNSPLVNVVKNPINLCFVVVVDLEKELFDPGY
jgi:hypothetical protein